MKIKSILVALAANNSTNAKKDILSKYKDNDTLRSVLYLMYSPRVKFYIKQIPSYIQNTSNFVKGIEWALAELLIISDRVLTGHNAIAYLKYILESVSSDDASVVERIIGKDANAGINLKLINDTFPKLIEKTPYMGAQSFSLDLITEIFNTNPFAISQVKMDGRYANAIISNDGVYLESRGGEVTYVGDAPFLKELSMFGECIVNGELTIDGVHRYIANGIVASIVDIEGKREQRSEAQTFQKISQFNKSHEIDFIDAISKLRYTVWDVIYPESYINRRQDDDYTDRLNRLQKLILDNNCSLVNVVEYKIVHSLSDAMTHFQKMLERGEEGTILKAPSTKWVDGKHKNQVKMKLELNLDLMIIGFNYGSEGTKNEHLISSLECSTSDGLLVTHPGGITESDMKYITKNQENLRGAIIECKCSGLSQNKDGKYSTLHPVFKHIRDDKYECDSLESAKRIEEMAKGLLVI